MDLPIGDVTFWNIISNRSDRLRVSDLLWPVKIDVSFFLLWGTNGKVIIVIRTIIRRIIRIMIRIIIILLTIIIMIVVRITLIITFETKVVNIIANQVITVLGYSSSHLIYLLFTSKKYGRIPIRRLR